MRYVAMGLVCLISLVMVSLSAAQRATLSVPITVRENVGATVDDYPTSVVVPLPQGMYSDVGQLGIAETASQVEVLERWPQDNSLRHVLVHFQATVSADATATYHLTDNGRTNPSTPVTVTDRADEIEVNTGPLRFIVSKQSFNLFDQLWLDANGDGNFATSERLIDSHAQNGGHLVPRTGAGGTQYNTSRTDLTVEIEENGPLRTVIRVEAPTLFNSTTDHQHGFAVRIYAYAGQPFVKVDYQLQNSARVVRSWPLYFEGMNLDLQLNLGNNPTVTYGMVDGTTYQTTAPSHLAQERHDQYTIYNGAQTALTNATGLAYNTIADGAGFVDISDGNRGVTTVVRNFWQMWPNGLAVDDQNKLSLQLFPEWSAQWEGAETNGAERISPTGLYWLKDMQHVYKETLFLFHADQPANDDLMGLAKTFQFHPVGSLPTSWHRDSAASLNLGGMLPPDSSIPNASDSGSPDAYWTTSRFDDGNRYYGGNWRNFGDAEAGGRTSPCGTGGWPYSAAAFFANGNSADYFLGELGAIGELNVRPQWLTNYTHTNDYNTLKPTENPYCGGTWRVFEGNTSVYAADLLPDTEDIFPDYGARDDQHGWFYHVTESYFYTGNPWVKDWLEFIVQFRRTRLDGLDPVRERNSRATAHALNHALQAARVAGDEAFSAEFLDHLRTYLRPEQDMQYGDLTTDGLGGGFQTGYLTRTIIDYMEYVRDEDPQAYAEAFNYLSGLMVWNLNYGNFPYFFNAENGGTGVSSGTGMTLIDPQAWYYWHTGKQAYWQQIEDYIDGGINGGAAPYGTFANWSGQYEGRYYQYVLETPRSDTTPPPTITNLTATQINASQVVLQWTAPSDAARYHVVWCDKPIVEAQSLDTTVCNWWAANAVGPDLTPTPNQAQSLTIDVGNASPVYAAIFSFDAAENMSALSNVAQAQTGQVTLTPPATHTPIPTNTPTGPPATPTNTPLPPTSTPSAGNEIHIFAGDSFEAAVESLQPGDTLIVHAGDYIDSGRISIGVDGTADNPVVIMGAEGEAKPRILRSADANPQNTINIEDASYLTIRGLEIMSNGGDGIKFHGTGGNHNIILHDLKIHGVDVGVNFQQDADNITVQRTQIYDTGTNGATGLSTGNSGEGMYIGCHDGSCAVSNSSFHNNWIHDTRNGTAGDGIEIKKGSYGNGVFDNVIYNTSHPCILLYGTEGEDRNHVGGNVMWGCSGSGIQAAADAFIYNNIVFESSIGFNSHTHNGVTPSSLAFIHNTIYNTDTCLNIRDWNNSTDIIFANNAIYCDSDTFDLQGGHSGVTIAGNVIYPAAAALPSDGYTVGISAEHDFVDPTSGNLYPSSPSFLIGMGTTDVFITSYDFDAHIRDENPDAGAYEWMVNSAPLWPIQPGFKWDDTSPPVGCIDDVVISLYRTPDAADRAAYEAVLGHFADAVFEMSNGVHRICNITIHQNQDNWENADIVWKAERWPMAIASGISRRGANILLGDRFPFSTSYDVLDPANHCGAGYTLAHEWGHYFYGLYDEYPRLVGDVQTGPSVMAYQWAACPERGGDLSWLNFSYPDILSSPNNQWRVYEADGWTVLARPPAQDPQTGYRPNRLPRPHYPELAAVAPDNTPTIDLPNALSRADMMIDWVAPSRNRTSDDYEAFIITVGGTADEPLRLVAGVAKLGLPLKAVSLAATVTQPDGQSIDLILRDDGLTVDDAAGDGLYSAEIAAPQIGNYTINVTVTNPDGTAQISELAYSSAPSPYNGDDYEPSSSPAIDEAFSVSAESTITISGVPTAISLGTWGLHSAHGAVMFIAALVMVGVTGLYWRHSRT